MPISFTEYVDITSGVIGADEVRQRELITRVFTTNELVPANSYAEFPTLADVGAYFGVGSVEYARADFYFAFLSKMNLQPQKISFASWVDANRAPYVIGDPGATATLAAFQAITAGTLNLQLGASTIALSGLDLATAGSGEVPIASLTALATYLTTQIQAAFPGDPVVAGAVVSFNPTSPLGAVFELLGGGSAGAGTIGITAGVTPADDLGILLGWESALAVISQGAIAQTLTQCMTNSDAASNNFGSFCFIQDPDAETPGYLTTAQIAELATWVATKNLMYIFLAAVTATNAAEVYAAVSLKNGTCLTLAPLVAEFPEMLPGAILAATDYTQANASQNYMYQQAAGLTPSVADNTDQQAYDNLRTNYYGLTQQAGQTISFYQRGVLCGAANSPSDINVFANEIWFKSYVGDAWMNALLALNEIPANASGTATALGIIQSCIAAALFNGTISVGNPLSNLQIAAINALAGSNNPNAWRQVQTLGYWFTVSFSSYVTETGATEWQCNYTLIYTKNNAIRKVVGTHNLV